eukprot:2345193-Rhodomonas_salina.5
MQRGVGETNLCRVGFDLILSQSELLTALGGGCVDHGGAGQVQASVYQVGQFMTLLSIYSRA